MLQQVVHLEWDQGLREIVHDNNSSIEQIVAEVRRINLAITGGLNSATPRISAKGWHRSYASAPHDLSFCSTVTSWKCLPRGSRLP